MGNFRVAVDTGGTFTDVLLLDADTGQIQTVKVPSTPANPDEAVIQGVLALGVPLSDLSFLGHGTTVAINTLVQRKGAATGLITTTGFRDVLEIQRTNRPDMYNLFFRKPAPLAPRNLRAEVHERVAADGTVQTILDFDELRAAVETLLAQGINSLAICFLNAYANPVHEEMAAAHIRQAFPDLPVTASVEIAREWREYERTSTAVLNAYLAPSVRRYLARLDDEMQQEGYQGRVLITRSDGGLTLSQTAAQQPAAMLMSGPAGGVLGAAEYGRAAGYPNLITFDIGGTTCDVSLIRNGQPTLVRDRLVEEYPVLAPFIDIYSIGAGGGTLGWADTSKMLRVGPQSAGAVPGPACYGRGGDQPAITDAYVALGWIDPTAFLGGKMPLQPDLAHAALARLADVVGMDPLTCALGMITILDHAMTAALRVVSVERGHDPRDFTLMAFGGAGALHLGALARELGIRRGIVPRYPSLFSAWGILAADLRHAYSQTVNRGLEDVTTAQLNTILGELRDQGEAQLEGDGVARAAMSFVASVDMRYAGQEHNVNVPAPLRLDDAGLRALVARFHAAHKQLYTFELPHEPVVMTTVRLDAIGHQPAPRLTAWIDGGTAAEAHLGHRQAIFDLAQGFVATPIYDRNRLGAGSILDGPCIIEEETATTIVHPDQTVTVDYFGNLVLEFH